MASIVDVTLSDANVNPGSNVVTYTQSLNYKASEGALTPENYVMLPFTNDAYNSKLVDTLKSNIAAFGNLDGLISTPEIVPDNGGGGNNNSSDDGGLSVLYIILIAVGGAVVLCCCAFGAYKIGNRDSRQNDGYIDQHDENNRPSEFLMSHGGGDDDIISTMDDPTVAKIGSNDVSAVGGYGDQR